MIMDYRMPGETGVECTKKIIELDPSAKVILFSVFESEEEIWKAVKAGVKGYLTKNASAVEDVMEAVREVMNGKLFSLPRLLKRSNCVNGKLN